MPKTLVIKYIPTGSNLIISTKEAIDFGDRARAVLTTAFALGIDLPENRRDISKEFRTWEDWDSLNEYQRSLMSGAGPKPKYNRKQVSEFVTELYALIQTQKNVEITSILSPAPAALPDSAKGILVIISGGGLENLLDKYGYPLCVNEMLEYLNRGGPCGEGSYAVVYDNIKDLK